MAKNPFWAFFQMSTTVHLFMNVSLSTIARTEPQAAYAAFTAGFKHKLTYFLRTIPNIADLVERVDNILDSKFIPAITENQTITERVRKLLSLPVRLGGLGLPIFSESCNIEFGNSRKISKYLINKIVAQDERYEINPKRERDIHNQIKKEKETRNNNMFHKVMSIQNFEN